MYLYSRHLFVCSRPDLGRCWILPSVVTYVDNDSTPRSRHHTVCWDLPVAEVAAVLWLTFAAPRAILTVPSGEGWLTAACWNDITSHVQTTQPSHPVTITPHLTTNIDGGGDGCLTLAGWRGVSYIGRVERGVLHWQGGEGCLTLTGWREVSYVIDGSGEGCLTLLTGGVERGVLRYWREWRGVSYVIDGGGEGRLTLLTGVERGVLRYWR